MPKHTVKQHLSDVKSLYENGYSAEEIAIMLGISRQSAKRALSETGNLYLSWHKSFEEDRILRHLHQKGIKTLAQLLTKY